MYSNFVILSQFLQISVLLDTMALSAQINVPQHVLAVRRVLDYAWMANVILDTGETSVYNVVIAIVVMGALDA